tara:strand:+ start:204 stop:542 length:339 start_codon:yes stop_codon:yes gene_type:complete
MNYTKDEQEEMNAVYAETESYLTAANFIDWLKHEEDDVKLLHIGVDGCILGLFVMDMLPRSIEVGSQDYDDLLYEFTGDIKEYNPLLFESLNNGIVKTIGELLDLVGDEYEW